MHKSQYIAIALILTTTISSAESQIDGWKFVATDFYGNKIFVKDVSYNHKSDQATFTELWNLNYSLKNNATSSVSSNVIKCKENTQNTVLKFQYLKHFAKGDVVSDCRLLDPKVSWFCSDDRFNPITTDAGNRIREFVCKE